MLGDELRDGLTFEDVLLVPAYSQILPAATDTLRVIGAGMVEHHGKPIEVLDSSFELTAVHHPHRDGDLLAADEVAIMRVESSKPHSG
jgi:hypothetical protein